MDSHERHQRAPLVACAPRRSRPRRSASALLLAPREVVVVITEKSKPTSSRATRSVISLPGAPRGLLAHRVLSELRPCGWLPVRGRLNSRQPRRKGGMAARPGQQFCAGRCRVRRRPHAQSAYQRRNVTPSSRLGREPGKSGQIANQGGRPLALPGGPKGAARAVSYDTGPSRTCSACLGDRQQGRSTNDQADLITAAGSTLTGHSLLPRALLRFLPLRSLGRSFLVHPHRVEHIPPCSRGRVGGPCWRGVFSCRWRSCAGPSPLRAGSSCPSAR